MNFESLPIVMRRVIFVLLVTAMVCVTSASAYAQSVTTGASGTALTVPSNASGGVQIVAGIRGSLVVNVPRTAAEWVRIAKSDGDCTNTASIPLGRYAALLAPGNSASFDAVTWAGQFCVTSDSTTPSQIFWNAN